MWQFEIRLCNSSSIVFAQGCFGYWVVYASVWILRLFLYLSCFPTTEFYYSIKNEVMLFTGNGCNLGPHIMWNKVTWRDKYHIFCQLFMYTHMCTHTHISKQNIDGKRGDQDRGENKGWYDQIHDIL